MKLNHFYKTICSLLFVWYFISLVVCYIQPYHWKLKLTMEIVNVLCILIYSHILFGNEKKLKGIVGIVILALLCWYGYFTPIDASGYGSSSKLEALFFVVIDVSTFLTLALYLVDNILVPLRLKEKYENNIFLNFILNIATPSKNEVIF